MNRDADELRQRVKRRSGAMMSFVIGPVVLLVAAVKVVERHDYPAGDIRNEPLFWILVAIAALVLVGALVVGSIRELRRGDTTDRWDS